MLLFTQTYLYLGRKLKLPSGFDTVFWKRYGQAQVNLQLCFFHYDVDIVLQALCTRINSILDRPTDPLDLIKSIQAHSGNEMLAPLVKKEYKTTQIKVVTKNHQNKFKKKKFKVVDPENCHYCAKNKCNNLNHNRYFINKYKNKN